MAATTEKEDVSISIPDHDLLPVVVVEDEVDQSSDLVIPLEVLNQVEDIEERKKSFKKNPNNENNG